jgi:RHS repeat-associated protein
VEPDGRTTYYGQNGKVSRIVTVRGLTTRFSYDGPGGMLSQVIDGYGRIVSFNYNTDGRLSEIVHPDSTYENIVHTTLGYDPQGQLWRVTDAQQNPTAPAQATVEYLYEISSGRIIRESFANGTTYVCNYDDITDLTCHQGQAFAGRTIRAVNPDSGTTEVVLRVAANRFPTGRGESIPQNSIYVEDGRQYVAQYLPDIWGMITQRLDSPYTFSVDIGHYPATDLRARRITKTVDERALTQTFTWETQDPEARGRINKIAFTGDGLPDPNPATTPYSISYSYANTQFKGLPTAITQPNGGVWEYTYNDKGDVTQIKDPIRESPDALTVVDYEYYEDNPALPGRLKQVALTDRNGHSVTWFYDTQGGLNRKYVQVGATRILWLEYENDATGRRIKEILHRENGPPTATKYFYDNMGRLTKVVENYVSDDDDAHGEDDDENLVTKYEYDPSGLLTGIINPKGVKTEYVRDYRNRVKERHEDAGGLNLVTQYEYWGDDRIKTITDALNRPPTTFDYPVFPCYFTTYDQALITDPLGYQTRVRRNGLGQVLSVERTRNGSTFTPVLTASYDALGRPRSFVRGAQLATGYLYDWPTSCACGLGTSVPRKEWSNYGSYPASPGSEASVTFNEVDPLGRLTKRIRKIGPQASMNDPEPDADDAVAQYVYDPEGNLTDVLGPEGEHVVYGYDFADRLTSRRIMVGPNQDLVTTLTLDDAGNVKAATLPNGHTMEMEYDGADRLKRQFDSLGDMATYTYDLNGNVESRTDGLNHTWSYAYDSLDRLDMVSDPIIESPDRVTTYGYDAVHNLTTVVNYNLIKTCFTYDNIDRLTQVIEDCVEGDPENDEKKKVDGEAVEDIQDEDPLGGGDALVSTSTTNTKTEYVWDGRFMVGLKDADLNQTTFNYNNAGWPLSITYPGGGTMSYVYETVSGGNTLQVRRTDPRNVVTTYKFDQLWKPKERSYSGGGFTNRSETFTFNHSGRLGAATRFVPNTGTTTPESSWSRDFDPAGRVTGENIGFPQSPAYELGMAYNLDSSARTYSQTLCYSSAFCLGGREVDRVFDARFRLGGVSSGASVGESWTHDLADRRMSAVRPNGIVDTFGYDSNHRLTSLLRVIYYGGGIDPGILELREYGYDAVGNRTSMRNWMNWDRSEHYGYDNRDRLTGMDRGELLPDNSGVQTPLNHSTLASNQQWSNLDRRGNWKDFRETVNAVSTRRIADVNPANGYTCVAANAAVNAQICTTQPASVTLTYHPDGALKQNPLARVVGDTGTASGQYYVYDEEARVTKIHRGSSTLGQLLLEFKYDALGRRVETVEYICGTAAFGCVEGQPLNPPRRTRHIYNGLEVVQEYVCTSPPGCETWDLAREFVWGDSGRFPEPVAMVDYTYAGGGPFPGTGPQVYHYLRDALGSVVGLTNESGNLVERYTYDPYGKVFIERQDLATGAWTPTNASSFGNPWLWTGHRYDPAVGLYHTHFRTYSPMLGRWLQRDPIGYAAGSVNLYEHVLGNPLYWVDPLGLEPYNETASDADANAQQYQNAVQEMTQAINTAADIAHEALEFTGEAMITTATMLNPLPGDELAAGMMILKRVESLIERLENVAKKSARAKKLLEKAKKLWSKIKKKTDALHEERKVNNPFGCKGKPDHQAKVKELAEKARKEFPNDRIETERKIAHPNSNRRPDVQVIDRKTGRVKKIYEVERNPNGTYNRTREKEYDDLGIRHETHTLDPPIEPAFAP